MYNFIVNKLNKKYDPYDMIPNKRNTNCTKKICANN